MRTTYTIRFTVYIFVLILFNLLTSPYPRQYTGLGIDGGLNCNGITVGLFLNGVLLMVLTFWYLISKTLKTDKAALVGFIVIALLTVAAFLRWYYYERLCAESFH